MEESEIDAMVDKLTPVILANETNLLRWLAANCKSVPEAATLLMGTWATLTVEATKRGHAKGTSLSLRQMLDMTSDAVLDYAKSRGIDVDKKGG